MRRWIMLGCLGLLAGCGDDSHPPRLPQITDLGGPRLAHMQVVPIYFAGDVSGVTMNPFYRWIVGSSWLTSVGAEYGVGPGSVLATVQRTDAAPSQIDDEQVIDLLYQGLADGSLPQPTTGSGEVLYVVHLPANTVVTAGDLTSCVDFGGYHASARRGGVELAYAVLPECTTRVGNGIDGLFETENLEYVASHELIEAATDPYPGNHPALQLHEAISAWQLLGEETADLCVRGDTSGVWREAGFVTARSWSNAAAAAEQDPCVPAVDGIPYFNVVTSAQTMLRIPPGSQQQIQLTAWSSDTRPEWDLEVQNVDEGHATLTLGAKKIEPGHSTTLDIAVASATEAGTPIRGFVLSSDSSTYQFLPVLAVAGQRCESFAGCVECTLHAGCGFCADSDRCEPLDGSGGAQNGCSADQVTTLPGRCSGFCNAHRTSCGECASQPGCGWCAATGSCIAAADDPSHPESEACDYADWAATPSYCPQ